MILLPSEGKPSCNHVGQTETLFALTVDSIIATPVRMVDSDILSARETSLVGGNTTNGIEGYWGLFIRMVLGTYHFVSEKYIQRYIDERVYRFNTKELTVVDRFRDMFSDAIGKCDHNAV